MATGQRPRRDNVGSDNAIEWDPELGRTKRSTDHKPYPSKLGRRKRNAASSRNGNNSTSGGSGSSSNSSGSSSSSSSSSGDNSSSTGNTDDDRSDAHTSCNGRILPRGYRTGRTNISSPPKRRRSSSSVAARPTSTGQVTRDRTRRPAATHKNPHQYRRRGNTKRKKNPGFESEGKVVASTAGEGMAMLGGQVWAKVVRIALRAVVASWTGMTTAALKAVRTWQVRAVIKWHQRTLPGSP